MNEGTTTVTLTVNGVERSGDAEPRTLLSDFLRHSLELTGTHVGCDTASVGRAPCSSTAQPSVRA